jgi:hypothetical protein
MKQKPKHNWMRGFIVAKPMNDMDHREISRIPSPSGRGGVVCFLFLLHII